MTVRYYRQIIIDLFITLLYFPIAMVYLRFLFAKQLLRLRSLKTSTLQNSFYVYVLKRARFFNQVHCAILTKLIGSKLYL